MEWEKTKTRLSHAYGVSQNKEPLIFRAVGTAATFLLLLLLAGLCGVAGLKTML